MRTLTFAPYTDKDTSPHSGDVYALVQQSLYQSGKMAGDDRKVSRLMVKLMDAVEAAGVLDKAGRWQLPQSGAVLALEDDRFEFLQECWKGFRRGIPLSAAKLINAVDAAFDAAK